MTFARSLRSASLPLLLLLAACATRPSPAELPRPSGEPTPEVVAHRHLRAILARDWPTSAELTHPSELASTRAAFLPLFARDTTGMLSRRILGSPPQTDLSSLSDVAFNAQLYAFHVGLASQGTAMERFTDAEMLGVAHPHPDTAYVVYRWMLPRAERPIRGAQVVKLQRDQGQWWLSMLADFEGLREMLASQP